MKKKALVFTCLIGIPVIVLSLFLSKEIAKQKRTSLILSDKTPPPKTGSSHKQHKEISDASLEEEISVPPLSSKTSVQARSIRVQPKIINRKQRPSDSIPDVDLDKSADFVLQSGHVDNVQDIVVDPSGRFLISYGEYGSIKIWDIETGQVLRDYFHARRESGNNVLAMDPQGKFFATGASDGKVMIWSLYSNRLFKVIGEKKTRVTGVVINQFGQVWISFSFGGTQLWDINQDSPIRSKKSSYGSAISGIAADVRGRFCITFRDRNFALVDIQTGSILRKGHTKQKITAATMSPSGRLFALGNLSGEIQLRDTNTLQLIRTFKLKRSLSDNRISCIRISLNEETIVSGRSDIYFWNIETGETTKILKKAHNSINSLAFDPDGIHLFSGGSNGEIQMWDSKTGKNLKMFTALTRHHEFMVDTTSHISIDPEFRRLVTESGDAKINIWDLSSLKMLKALKAHKLYKIKSASKMDPKGHFLATCYRQGEIKLWDLETGTLRYLFQSDLAYYSLESFGFDSSGNYLLTCHTCLGKVPVIQIWSLKTGKIIQTIEGYHKIVVDPNGRFLAGITPSSNAVNIYSLPSGDLIHSYQTSVSAGEETPRLALPGQNMPVSQGIRQLIMGPKGNHILIAYYSGQMDLINTKTGRAIKDFRKGVSFKHLYDMNRLSFDPSGTHIIYTDRNTGLAGIWDADTGKIVCSIGGHKNGVTNVIINLKRRLAVTVSYESIKLWDLSSGTLTRTITGSGFKEPGVDPEWKYIAINAFEVPQVWNLLTGEKVRTYDKKGSLYEMTSPFNGTRAILLHQSNGKTANGYFGKAPLQTGHFELIDPFTGEQVHDPGLRFKDNYNKLIVRGSHVVSVDGRILTRIYNTVKRTSVALASSGPEWIAYTPDGYFDSSKYGGSLVAIVKNLNGYGPDQFAIRNNRPDLMLQGLGLGNQELIAHFHQQYQKRLKRFGFKQNQLIDDYHIPDAVILDAVQTGKFIKVDFRLTDTMYDLKSYNIYVNDVPLFGRRGREIKGRDVTLTEVIELTDGKNKIEISCFNEKGTESYRSLTFAEHDDRIKADLYYVGFGVSKYQDPSLNLSYAHKDAKDLETLFLRMKGAYHNVYTKLFINQAVNKQSMAEAREFLDQASVDDVIVLFIAGHGLHDSDKEATYYYLTYETDINRLESTAIPYSRLEDLLTDVTPRRKLLLMDTCESGEIDRDTQDVYFAQAGAGGFKPRTTRAIIIRLRQQKKKTPGVFLRDKDRYIYNDLIRRSGSVAFSSSRGNEFSYESVNVQNGFFTKGIIDTLSSQAADKDNNKYLSVNELQTHIMALVAEMSDDLQHPTIDRDNIHQKIELPVLLADLPHERQNKSDITHYGHIPKDHLHWHIGDKITVSSGNRADTGILRSIDALHVTINRGGHDKPDMLGIPHSNIFYIDLVTDSGKTASKLPKTFAGIPLLDAAAQGDLNAVENLLKEGADIHAKTYNGHTALTCALKFGYPDVAELLIKNGADVRAKTLDGITPIFYAVWKNLPATVALLIKNGADINAIDSYGRPLIHCAVGSGSEDATIVNLLLDNGAKIDASDKNGYTPLHSVAFGGSLDMARLLINRGLDVNTKVKNTHLTPLHVAAIADNSDMARFLLENGADVNAKSYSGDTTLKMVKMSYRKVSEDMVKLLESYGAKE